MPKGLGLAWIGLAVILAIDFLAAISVITLRFSDSSITEPGMSVFIRVIGYEIAGIVITIGLIVFLFIAYKKFIKDLTGMEWAVGVVMVLAIFLHIIAIYILFLLSPSLLP